MRHKLCFIVTSALTADIILRGQLKAMQAAGFDVSVVAAPDERLAQIAVREGVTVHAIPMQREIALGHDLVALWRLVCYLRRTRPTIVNASTPKAGLLGMLAAWLTGVPVRIYQVRGLRLETTRGIRRQILLVGERLAAGCAQHVVCDSPSLFQTLTRLHIGGHKLKVLGAGSSNGVDASRFHPPAPNCRDRQQLRVTLGIAQDAPVVGFIGRLTRDKGVSELLVAFDAILQSIAACRLLLIGMYEPGDPLPIQTKQRIDSDPRIIHLNYVPETADYYRVMDVLAFPSYREGLPTVPLEAAASSLPVVAFAATGTVDSVCDGTTGYLVPVGNIAIFVERMVELLQDAAKRRALGISARDYVEANFRQTLVWENWRNFYTSCLVQ